MPPKKAKPLAQKAEREMMGAEDIASTARELTDAKAKAVARMAKAREAKEAKAQKAKAKDQLGMESEDFKARQREREQGKLGGSPKESITMKVKEEAPYGYTASGKKRTKPLKEKAPKAPKAKAPKAPKAKKVYPPPSVNATAREQIGMVEEDLDARERERVSRSKPKPKLDIKVARRYIQLLEKGKNMLLDLYDGRGRFWTQDGYYTTVGDKSEREIQDELETYYGDYVDVFREATAWFKATYDGKRFDLPREMGARDERFFEPEKFGLEKNQNLLEEGDEDYDEYDEFNGEYLLGDYTDMEEGIDTAVSLLKQIVRKLEEGGFISPIEFVEEDEGWEEKEEDDESYSSAPSSRSSSASSVGTARWDEGSPSSSRSSSRSSSGYGLKGGALSAKELKGLLGASYDPKTTKVGDFVLDKSISTDTSKVYRNTTSGQVVVAHRGTEGLLDWGNNAVYALGGKTAYKMTPRYKEAEKVQKKAEAKYGKQNVSTIGHSQGGLQAELLGGKSKEIITLNKATRPFESNKNKNQYDVRSKGDVVSALNPFEKKSSKNVEIESGSYNPLKEHSGDILDRLEEDTMIGGAIRRVIEGGATPDQRAIAGVLRSRLRQMAQTNLGQYRDVKIKSLLNAILHSTDTAEDFDDFARMNPNLPRNPYVDYTDTYDYVVPSSTAPLPSKVIDDALRAFYSFMTAPANRKLLGERELFTKTLETYKSGNKEIDRDRDILINARMKKEGGIVEPTAPPTESVFNTGGGGGGGSSETPSTTSDAKAEKKAKKRQDRIDMLNKKLGERRLWWMEPNNNKFGGIARILDELIRSVVAPKIPSTQEERQDIFNDKFDRFKGEWVKLEKEILDDVNGIFKITGTDGRITMADLVDYGFIPVGYKIVLDRKFDVVPMDSSVSSTDKRRTYSAIKNPYDASLYMKKMGKGLPIPSPIVMGGAIDFEDMNWGSLTEQMKAYNNQHKKSLDLEGFARMIVAKPSDFQKRTLKRARFYLNVLLPKRKS